MFVIIYFQGDDELTRKFYNTYNEAVDSIEDNSIDSSRYEIYDTDKKDIVDKGRIENSNSMNEGTMDIMYPNNEEDY